MCYKGQAVSAYWNAGIFLWFTDSAGKGIQMNFMRNKKWLWAMVLSLLVAGCCVGCWFKCRVVLSVAYTAVQPVRLNVEGNFDSETSCATTLVLPGGKKKNVEIALPAESVKNVRLTFSGGAKQLNLHSVTLKGKSRQSLSEPRDFSVTGNLKLSGKKGNVAVRSVAGGNGVLDLKLKTPVEAAWRVAWGVLAALLIIPYYMVFVVCDYVSAVKSGKKSQVNVRLANVEFLRILFTLGVLVTHFFGQVFNIWTSGGQGVEFFFLLSGYLLAVTYKPERGMVQFARQKYIRFVPLVVVGGFMCSGGVESLYGAFMLQATGLSAYGIPNTPAWYIGVLFWCSLLYLGIFKAFSEKPRNLLIGVIAFVACLLAFKWELVQDLIPRSMLRGLSCMGIGCILAQCCKRESETGDKSWTWGCSLAEFVVLFYIIGGCFSKSIYIDYWIYRPISHTLLLYLFLTKKGLISNLCERPVFVYLARYSLGIYLTHWTFGTTVRTFVENHYPGWMDSHVALSITIAMVGSCLLGAAAYYIIELPCARYLNKWLPVPKS